MAILTVDLEAMKASLAQTCEEYKNHVRQYNQLLEGKGIGSRAVKARLIEHFDMTEADFAKLHGPVGLRLGAKTPAEIAVSIIAQIVQVKNAMAVASGSAESSCVKA